MPQDLRSRGGEGSRIGWFSKQFLCWTFNDPEEGNDNDGAVVGLALRFALNAPPFGLRRASRSARPTTRREPKNKNQKTNRQNRKANQNGNNSEIRTKAKRDTSNEVRNRTFLKSLDIKISAGLTSYSLDVRLGPGCWLGCASRSGARYPGISSYRLGLRRPESDRLQPS